MTASQPLCCSPRAYALLGNQLAKMSSSDALLNGAVAIAMHQMPDAKAESVDRKLQGYADTIRDRVRGSQPQALLAHLHQFLFDDLGLAGNVDDYYASSNSYLPAVLESRKGLPITLSLVYKLVAERIGIRCWGVGLPGHFMIGVENESEPMLVDAFAGGRVLTADEAHQRLQEMFGSEVQWSEELLRPASNRHWLTRILQNLLNVFGAAGKYSDVAAVLEMEMLLWPEQNHLQRDLGLVLARCGLSRPASIWIDRYLQTNPDDPQQSQLRELLQVLGT